VSEAEGQALARELGDAGFIEVSAKNNLKVRDAFEMLVRLILTRKPDAGQGGDSSGVFGVNPSKVYVFR
jgi:hypothetical protein